MTAEVSGEFHKRNAHFRCSILLLSICKHRPQVVLVLIDFTAVTKVLAYCGFLQHSELSLPAIGVDGAVVHALQESGLCFLWSEVDWPFQPRAMQQHAVQFHHVIAHMFDQGAVVPFQLLSMFDDQPSLATMVARHHSDFMGDLERLRGFVQMECVVYRQDARPVADRGPAGVRLQPKTETAEIASYVAKMRSTLAGISPDVRTREIKSGARIFALMERGSEENFHAVVATVAIPDGLSRRTSGPRPASAFVTAPAKTPHLAEAK